MEQIYRELSLLNKNFVILDRKLDNLNWRVTDIDKKVEKNRGEFDARISALESLAKSKEQTYSSSFLPLHQRANSLENLAAGQDSLFNSSRDQLITKESASPVDIIIRNENIQKDTIELRETVQTPVQSGEMSLILPYH